MKVLSLNTWGGRAGKEQLLSFLRNQSNDVDVICLQEVWSAPYTHLEGVSAGGLKILHDNVLVYGKQEISKLLPEFHYFFHPHHGDDYGLMMLVKKNIEVLESGDIFVHKFRGYVPEGDPGKGPRNIQYALLKTQNSEVTVCNFHGLWNGQGKTDSIDRLEQSDKIIKFARNYKNLVFCGDLNLLPETESIRKIEQAGYRNLISEYGVTSTRTSFYTKPEKFADYIFVSESIVVKNFEVLPDEVSDHAPLLIEFL